MRIFPYGWQGGQRCLGNPGTQEAIFPDGDSIETGGGGEDITTSVGIEGTAL